MTKNKYIKRTFCFIIIIVVMVTAIPFTALTTSAFSRFELYCEVSGGYSALTPVSSYDSIDVWINGGKVTYGTGTTSETKSAQLMLYEIVDGKYYNITSLKGIEWYVGDSVVGATQISGKYQKKNDKISISKGKVTAAKVSGTSYAFAYRAAEEKGGTPTFLAVAKINVMLAPQKVSVYDKVSSAPSASSIKGLSLGLGENTWVYPLAEMKKESDNSLLDDYSSEFSYSVAIDKNATNLSLSTSYQVLDPGEPIIEISASEMALGLNIAAHAINPDKKVTDPYSDDRQDKTAKINVIITNRQSGKSMKIPVTIENKVIDFTVPEDNQYVYTSADRVAEPMTVDLDPFLSGNMLSPAYVGSSTTKPLIGVYTTDQSELFSTYIDSKGKLKLPSANKTSDVNVAVCNKANTKLRIAFKKASYTEPKTIYIVVAYGTSIESQIKQFQLTLFSPSYQSETQLFIS